MNIFLPAFATENWSRETGSAVPSRVSLIISILRLNLVLTYGIPPEFRGGVHLSILNRHTPSCQSQVYRVTQLRADGVHCRRESAGTGAVVLKVVPVTSAAFSGTIDQLICASLSHTHYWFEVGMLKVPAAITIHYYTVPGMSYLPPPDFSQVIAQFHGGKILFETPGVVCLSPQNDRVVV